MASAVQSLLCSVGNLGAAHLQDQQRCEALHRDACMPAKCIQTSDLLLCCSSILGGSVPLSRISALALVNNETEQHHITSADLQGLAEASHRSNASGAGCWPEIAL
jgi:hypothetical protein